MVSEGTQTNFWWRVIALATLRERYAREPGGGARVEEL
jgi:hypothetical protein